MAEILMTKEMSQRWAGVGDMEAFRKESLKKWHHSAVLWAAYGYRTRV